MKRITFTEGLTYEDFFGCYKPSIIIEDEKEKITYRFVPGPFCQIVCDAIKNPHNNYVLVIEELNRGHAYEIMGTVFQLLDRDETGASRYGISLSEDAAKWFRDELSEDEAHFDPDSFKIPQNLYIACTMNNADAGVQFLDTAFKRRFISAYIDEEGEIYGSALIAGIDSSGDEDTDEGGITYEEYHNYRTDINKVLTKLNKPEDRLISKHFINIKEDESIDNYDFIINILGYLLQNVFRNDQLPSQIFTDPDIKSLSGLLKKYKNEGSLESVFNTDISNSINTDLD